MHQFFLVPVLLIIILLIFLRDAHLAQDVGDALAVDLEVALADLGVRIQQLIPQCRVQAVVVDALGEVQQFVHQLDDVVGFLLLDARLVVHFFAQFLGVALVVEVHGLGLRYVGLFLCGLMGHVSL